MDRVKFVIIDCETTGLEYAAGDKILEIAVVGYLDEVPGEVLLHTLVNPRRSIGQFHEKLLDPKLISEAPTFEDIAAVLLACLRDKVVVAHNAKFDLQFLRGEFEDLGISLPPLFYFCTCALARKTFDLRSYSLTACCEALTIDHTTPHHALPDARAVESLFRILKGRIPYSTLRRELRADKFNAHREWPCLALDTSPRMRTREG